MKKSSVWRGIIVATMLFIGICMNHNVVFAADDSGVDGEIYWEINGDTLTLSAVEGTTGKMKDYDFHNNEFSQWCLSSYYENVDNIVIEDTVTQLGKESFTKKNTLKLFKVPGSAEIIPMCFSRGTTIEKLIIAEGVEKIDVLAFLGGRVREVEIPRSVKSIELSAFTAIGDGNWTYLEKVYGYTGSEAENYVNSYNKYAIQTRENGCSELGDIIGIVEWGDDDRWSETALIEFIPLDDEGIPDTETTPDTESSADANSGVDGEIAWKIEGDILTLSAVEGTAGKMKDYDVNTNAPWQETESIKNVKRLVVDNTVTELGKMAFKNEVISFEKVEIAGSVKVVPSEFCWRGDIDELIINEGVEKIEDNAFLNCDIKTVTIPKSVSEIGNFAFVKVADSVVTSLRKVYGYAGSTAEKLVDDYNTWATQTKETGRVDGIGMFYIIWSDENEGTKEGQIEFIALDEEKQDEPKENPYELIINQNYTDANLGNYNIDGIDGSVIYESYPEELQKVLDYFKEKYPVEKLIPLDISLSENGVTVSAKECTIKLPVPKIWDSKKEHIKVLTVTDGQIEVVSSKIVLESDTYYISFVPPHFSPYALYLDYVESETGTGDNETDVEENVTNTEENKPTDNNASENDTGSSDKELDDTPKTGSQYEPMMIAIICLFLLGVGILVLPRKEF